MNRPRLQILISVVMFCLGGASGPSLRGQALRPQCTSGSPGVCAAVLGLRGGGLMPYYRNLALEGQHLGIRRAVVVVHGKSRNAPDYFSYIVQAAREHLGETIVIAPHFKEEASAGQLAWGGDGWKQGGLSTVEPPRSSFDIIDQFLSNLSDKNRFPNLRTIVVTGNSAGGQFVQRYAATNRLEPQLSALQVRYVVSNPGSYMYLNDRRWINGDFEKPDYWARHFGCRRWNHYRYGVRERDGYVGLVSTDEIRAQYPARDVTYLVGEKDTENGDLDDGCQANYQGRTRVRRGKLFFDFMNTFFPGHRHKFRMVAGVDHSASRIYMSPEAQEVLFPILPFELPPVGPILPRNPSRAPTAFG